MEFEKQLLILLHTLTEDGEIFMNNDKIIVGERHTSDLLL